MQVSARIVWCCFALLTLLAGVAAAQGILVNRTSTGPLIPKASQGEQCVADTDLMRREHMSLLDHQRDDTVIEGIRGEPFSLVGCVNCHAQSDTSGEPIRIDAKGQFCETCHSYAAVKIDCFTCHAAKPESGQVIGALTPGHSPVFDSLIVPVFTEEHSLLSMSALSLSAAGTFHYRKSR